MTRSIEIPQGGGSRENSPLRQRRRPHNESGPPAAAAPPPKYHSDLAKIAQADRHGFETAEEKRGRKVRTQIESFQTGMGNSLALLYILLLIVLALAGIIILWWNGRSSAAASSTSPSSSINMSGGDILRVLTRAIGRLMNPGGPLPAGMRLRFISSYPPGVTHADADRLTSSGIVLAHGGKDDRDSTASDAVRREALLRNVLARGGAELTVHDEAMQRELLIEHESECVVGALAGSRDGVLEAYDRASDPDIRREIWKWCALYAGAADGFVALESSLNRSFVWQLWRSGGFRKGGLQNFAVVDRTLDVQDVDERQRETAHTHLVVLNRSHSAAAARMLRFLVASDGVSIHSLKREFHRAITDEKPQGSQEEGLEGEKDSSDALSWVLLMSDCCESPDADAESTEQRGEEWLARFCQSSTHGGKRDIVQFRCCDVLSPGVVN